PAQVALWMRESGWDRFAYNASSGATGIPQALPYSKMPRAAWLPFQGGAANAAAQIGWGYGYEASRYGNPLNAYGHELAVGWYGSGIRGLIVDKPTVIGVGERGRERVDVTPAGWPGPLGRDQDAVLSRLDRILAAVQKTPGRTGAATAEALTRVGRLA